MQIIDYFLTFYPEYYIMTKMFLRNGGRLFDNGCASYFEALRAAERICGFADLHDGSDRAAFVFAITRGEENNEGNNERDIEGDIGLGIERNQIRSRT